MQTSAPRSLKLCCFWKWMDGAVPPLINGGQGSHVGRAETRDEPWMRLEIGNLSQKQHLYDVT